MNLAMNGLLGHRLGLSQRPQGKRVDMHAFDVGRLTLVLLGYHEVSVVLYCGVSALPYT